MNMNVQALVCGAYEGNAYIVSLSGRGDCVVVDPGDDADALIRAVSGKTVAGILLTHGHFDHILAADALHTATGAPVFVGADDLEMVKDARLSLYDEGASRIPFVPIPYAQAYGEHVDLAGMLFSVMPTPGHTPGSVCLYEEKEGVLFTGDTLFMHGYGRTDFPGGSFDQLRRSLRKLFAMPGQVIFYPGHGAGGRMEENR